MNGTQILEPVFHVVSNPLGRVRKERPAKSARSSRTAGAVSFLERLGLCRAPRILSAVCLQEEPILDVSL